MEDKLSLDQSWYFLHFHVSLCCVYAKAAEGTVLCCAEQLVKELKVGGQADVSEEQALVTATALAANV